MKRFVTASGLFVFLLFLFVGGTWISLVNFLPQDVPRGLLTMVLGLVFVATFLFDMVVRIRHVLDGSERLWTPLVLTVLNVIFLLVVFAGIYYQFGIIDTTRPQSPVIGAPGGSPGRDVLPGKIDGEGSPSDTGGRPEDPPRDTYSKLHQFALCCYFSIITFTTVGYGDFQPISWGRAMAGLEAMVGYLVLGILASTSASLLQASVKDRPSSHG